MKTKTFILKGKEEEYKIDLEIFLNYRNKNKFYCLETVFTACNSEGIVTCEYLREYVEQFLTAQIFCQFEDSSSDTSLLKE
jgi:hypothetical protein